MNTTLWRIAEEIGERELKGSSKPDDLAEFIEFADPATLTSIVGLELTQKVRGNKSIEHKAVNRLSAILYETAKVIADYPDSCLNYNTIMILYNSMRAYSKDLMPFKIDHNTEMKDLAQVVSEKTNWVAQELENTKMLSESRLNGIRDFCNRLYHAIADQEAIYETPSERHLVA